MPRSGSPTRSAVPRVLLLAAHFRFASVEDDDYHPRCRQDTAELHDGFAGLDAENLLARPFVQLGCWMYLLTRAGHWLGSGLEIILVDLEQLESVVRLTPAESSGSVELVCTNY